jgi:hypothetical protein
MIALTVLFGVFLSLVFYIVKGKTPRDYYEDILKRKRNKEIR